MTFRLKDLLDIYLFFFNSCRVYYCSNRYDGFIIFVCVYVLVLLASFCIWTKLLVCKDAVIRDSTIQSDVRRLCLQVKKSPVPCQLSGRSSHPVRTPICPLFHPSGRRAFPSRPFTVLRRFYTSLHPSGRLSSPSGHLLVLD
jgi:hypothetical protein